jgi:hypothetical protein
MALAFTMVARGEKLPPHDSILVRSAPKQFSDPGTGLIGRIVRPVELRVDIGHHLAEHFAQHLARESPLLTDGGVNSALNAIV